jgi:hypothetical protein
VKLSPGAEAVHFDQPPEGIDQIPSRPEDAEK